MSDTTLQAVHDAIAAHIADVSEGDALLLTDWHVTAGAPAKARPAGPHHHTRPDQPMQPASRTTRRGLPRVKVGYQTGHAHTSG